MTQIARVKTVWSGWAGAPGITTHYFRKFYSGAWSAIPTYLCVQVKNAWNECAALFPEDLTLTVQPQIDIIEDSTGTLQFQMTGTQQIINGSSTAGFGPLATGVQVRFGTNSVVYGHALVGSTFLAPIASEYIQIDGTPQSTGLGLAEAFGEQLSQESYGQMVVWSRPNPAKQRPGVSYDVTEATVKDTFAILKSRRD